jgi:hypothetical protein
MLAQPVALNQEQHKDLKILQKFSTEILNDRHIAPLMLQEFTATAAYFPIFFLKAQDAEVYSPVAVFGLKDGQNLFMKDGQWEGQYLPAGIRAYPFTLAQASEEQLVLCVNEKADNVSTTEGQALFTADGKPTEFLDGLNTFFKDYIDANGVSRNIMAQLAEMGLFRADGLQYRDAAGNERRLNGFYVIDREKFENLTDEQFLAVRKFGVLPAIYAHFMSLDRIGALIARLPVEAKAE